MDLFFLDTNALKALTNDARKKILIALSKRPHTLSEMSAHLNISKPTIKDHLVLLETSGFIEKEKTKRKWKYYSLTKKGVALIEKKEVPRYLITLFASLIVALSSVFILLSVPSAPVGIEEAALPEGEVISVEEMKAGKLVVVVTDDEFEKNKCNFYVKEFRVKFDELLLQDLRGQWTSISLGNATMDITEAIGVDQLISEYVIEEGVYNQVKLRINSVIMVTTTTVPMDTTDTKELIEFLDNTTNETLEGFEGEGNDEQLRRREIRVSEDGGGVEIEEEIELKLPSNELKFEHELEIDENETEVLELDFDLEDSIVCAGEGKIILRPVISMSSLGNATLRLEGLELEIEKAVIEKESRFKFEPEGDEWSIEKTEEERGEEKIEINMERNEARIDIEINGIKSTFVIDDTTLDGAVREITQRTGLSESEILDIAEIESKEEIEEEEREIEIEVEENVITMNILGYKIVLTDVTLDEALSILTETTGLDVEDILKEAEIRIEKTGDSS